MFGIFKKKISSQDKAGVKLVLDWFDDSDKKTKNTFCIMLASEFEGLEKVRRSDDKILILANKHTLRMELKAIKEDRSNIALSGPAFLANAFKLARLIDDDQFANDLFGNVMAKLTTGECLLEELLGDEWRQKE